MNCINLRWIKTSELLPLDVFCPDSVHVLAWNWRKVQEVGFRHVLLLGEMEPSPLFYNLRTFAPLTDITHWMQMPPPPTED